MDWIETAKQISSVVSPALAGGGLWAYLEARQKARKSPPASIATSQASLVAALTAQTTALLTENAKDRRYLKTSIIRQGKELKRVSAEIAHCHAKHADCEDNLAEVRAQIARLMDNHPPATYPHDSGEQL